MATGITSRELVEQAAYDQLDPPLGYRIDAGFAYLAWLVYNRTRGKGEPARRVEDFMPRYGPETPQSLEDKLRLAFTALGK